MLYLSSSWPVGENIWNWANPVSAQDSQQRSMICAMTSKNNIHSISPGGGNHAAINNRHLVTPVSRLVTQDRPGPCEFPFRLGPRRVRASNSQDPYYLYEFAGWRQSSIECDRKPLARCKLGPANLELPNEGTLIGNRRISYAKPIILSNISR